MAANVKGITDLISVQTITWAANKIANSARAFARVKNIGKVAHVGVGTAHVTKNTLTIDVMTSRAGMAFEKGSGLHDPKGAHFIPIEPKTKQALWFPYDEGKIFPGVTKYKKNGVVGITTKHVNHPGVKARPFIQPAREKHRQEILDRISLEVGDKMRIAIRGMSRKI